MVGDQKMSKIVLISGGFDPIHSGHIKLINEANKYGDVVVLLNSDEWLRNKKGKEFLPFNERKIIMQNIKGVIDVIEFDDRDKSCIDGLKKAKAKYHSSNLNFANGGDRNDKTTAETSYCYQNKIATLWGVGGNNKSNSSSWILKKWNEKN